MKKHKKPNSRNIKSYNGLTSKTRKKRSAYNRSAARKIAPAEIKTKAMLPTEVALNHLFNRFNNLYFDGRLKKVKIEYSDRMTCAGSYCPEDKLIKLSTKYHLLFPSELDDTLKHEMIHIKHFFHDADFKREANRIGASLKAKSHPLLGRVPKFIYVCPGCGEEYPRQKKMHRYSCGDCSANSRYDERFRLRLIHVSKSANKRA